MHTRYMMVARYAEYLPDGTVNILGGDDGRIVAASYPHVFKTILVATRITFNEADGMTEHPFRTAVVEDESGEVIADGPFGVIPPVTFPPGTKELGSGLIIQFNNVIFPRAGRYLVQLLVDETLIATTAVRVAPLAYFQAQMKALQEGMPERDDHGTHDSSPD